MNWSGTSAQVPICFQAPSHEQILMNGCMMVKQVPHIVSYPREIPQTGAIAKRMEEWDLFEIIGDEASTFSGVGMIPQGHSSCPRELNFSIPGPIWSEYIQEVPRLIMPPESLGSLSLTGQRSLSMHSEDAAFVQEDLIHLVYSFTM